jgi:formate C-acetyltransferase
MLVFDERRVSLPELVEALRANWEGHDDLRRYAARNVPLYGNDDDRADGTAARVFDDYVRLVKEAPEADGVLRPAGISTFARQVGWREHRRATPFGTLEGETLANNMAPVPGTHRNGPTAVIASYCRMDFTRLANGGTLDLALFPSTTAGEDGLRAIETLIRGFIALGGWYLSVDTQDPAILRDAQEHPERHQNLVVRIAGWCARFNSLHRDWQEMIIRRAEGAA